MLNINDAFSKKKNDAALVTYDEIVLHEDV